MEFTIFAIMAAASLLCAVMVLAGQGTLESAAWFTGCLVAVAGIFALQAAPFLAVAELLLAAVAMMALVLSAIVFIRKGGERHRRRVLDFGRVLGGMAAAYLAIVLVVAIWRPPFLEAPGSGQAYEAPSSLAMVLFGRYAAAFELAGVLLVVTTVAAIALVKREEARGGDAGEGQEVELEPPLPSANRELRAADDGVEGEKG